MAENSVFNQPGTSPKIARDHGRKIVLRADGVRRFYIDGDHRLDVLKGVSIAVHAGEVAAMVGRSGSGKSTLLHLLGLLDRPDDGEILIDGTPVSKLSETNRSLLRNTQIGFVFQHYFLLPEYNVFENVLMPAKVACSPFSWLTQRKKYFDRASDLIRLVGLGSLAKQKPNVLSGGERQRVALARALMLEPKILLCDEPTGNLDPETASHIMDMIFECSQTLGTAVLVVTHDQSLSARARQVFRLDSGFLNIER